MGGVLGGEPEDRGARVRSSAWWSRKPQVSGVQPRAPGIASQSSLSSGSPGRPVHG